MLNKIIALIDIAKANFNENRNPYKNEYWKGRLEGLIDAVHIVEDEQKIISLYNNDERTQWKYESAKEIDGVVDLPDGAIIVKRDVQGGFTYHDGPTVPERVTVYYYIPKEK